MPTKGTMYGVKEKFIMNIYTDPSPYLYFGDYIYAT